MPDLTKRLHDINEAIRTAEKEGVYLDRFEELRDILTPLHANYTRLGNAIDTGFLDEIGDNADRGEAVEEMLRGAGFTVSYGGDHIALVPTGAALAGQHGLYHPEFPLTDWQERVSAGLTVLGYWDDIRARLLEIALASAAADRAGSEASE